MCAQGDLVLCILIKGGNTEVMQLYSVASAASFVIRMLPRTMCTQKYFTRTMSFFFMAAYMIVCMC